MTTNDPKRTLSYMANNKVIAISAVAHAALVTADWMAMLYWGSPFISARLWFVVGWLWLVWPVLLFVTKARSSRVAIAGVVLGAVTMLPSIPVIYSFTAWSIQGFAP